jgi:dihydroxyacetone kinase-like protein
MLDVLIPASQALSAGKSAAEIKVTALAAADATMPLKATRGRASFLGDRSIGHMDPGSRSSALIIATICDHVGDAA